MQRVRLKSIAGNLSWRQRLRDGRCAPANEGASLRVFFHLCDHAEFLLDQQGMEMDVAEVPALALKAAREIVADDALTGSINMGYSLEVRDQAGKGIHTLYFKDAVRIVGLE